MYKHYIKTDENNNITDAFSSWQKEKFDGTEILYRESSDRHFQLDLIDIESGLYKYKHENNQVILKPEEEIKPLDYYKEIKKQEILSSFEYNLSKGYFESTTLGIEVDCRRAGIKNDLQNVESLIRYMNRSNVTKTDYVGYKVTKKDVSISNLEALVIEMENHVLGLYQKKWTLEEMINSVTEKEELDLINW